MRLEKQLLIAVLVVLFAAPAQAQEDGTCWNSNATAAFRDGFDHQKAGRTGDAVRSYRRCLEIESDCVPCNYEIGWSYWVQERWTDVIGQWERVLELEPGHADATRWLREARAKAPSGSSNDSGDWREPTPPRSDKPSSHDGPVGDLITRVIDAGGTGGTSGLPSCKQAKGALRDRPEKPGGRTRRGSSPKPDPSGMRRVTGDDPSSLPGYDTGRIRPRSLEGSGTAMDRIRRVFDKGDNGGRVRISVFGASHTSGDRWTGRMRRVLQKRWGDLGHGHILPGALYKYYGGRDVGTCRTDGWLSDWTGKANAHEDGLLGYAGMSVSSSHPEEFGWLETRSKGKYGTTVSSFELFTLAQPGGGTLEVWVDDGPRHRIDTNSSSPALMHTSIRVSEGGHRLTVSPVGDGEVRVFGISMERAGGGAIVDAMGIRGMEARTWLSWNRDLFRVGIQRISPDLVVLAYGTNEAADQDYTMDEYRRDLSEVLQMLKDAAGENVACVLAGPSDRGWDFKDGSYAIWDRTAPVADVQRQVAREFDCAFWDWQEAMGGPGSMVAWKLRDPKYGSNDLIHHTPSGYSWLADRFLKAIDGL